MVITGIPPFFCPYPITIGIGSFRRWISAADLKIELNIYSQSTQT